ncbi:hypothetical protein FB567DRAFT_625486 [Paraphoma chrysanthemicola]|uniref:Uncharacterized protein n=1 Tax=Paraphoma chrysanthemicola TaxID=798071 RepID=A0A8K0RDS7_9PLEO|nr:hypothetical protein FB567DRAFT_625486 [Paraphoma chrysanthemicola]
MIETVCWAMLDMATALHERGPVVLRVFDDSKLKNAHNSRKLTLAQRIGFICDLLRLKKSRCETLLNYDDIDMTIAAPAQMIAMAKTNKKQNIKRQTVLVSGRETLMVKGRLAAKGAIVDGEEGRDDKECHNNNHQGPVLPTPSYILAAHHSACPIVDTAEPNALLLQ